MTPYDIAAMAQRQGSNRVVLQSIEESASSRQSYLAALRRMLRALASEIRILLPRYTGDELSEDIAAMQAMLVATTEEAVQRILDLEAQRHTDNFHEIARRALGVDLGAVVRKEDLGEWMTATMSRNASLIKNLADDAVARAQRAVADTVLRGQTQRELRARISQELRVLDRRAKIIARDQTAKAVSDLNAIRHQQAGITHYVWSTSMDERVRPLHRRLNGQEFAYASRGPAEGGGHPGQPIMCRCTARAVVKFN